MLILTKKKINAKLIKLQNEYGKVLGRVAWQEWKIENDVRQSR
jgi:hypothetical protein